MSAWSHLPNANHIDWVIASVKETPDIWARAWALDAALNAARLAAWDATLYATRNADRDRARYAAVDATRIVTQFEARIVTWDATLYATRNAARSAIAALVAYDDCEQYLSMTYEQLRAWALLSETPQAVLLLPMKWVQENEQHNGQHVSENAMQEHVVVLE